MIVLIRVENFYKIQHPFMIKNKKQKTNTSWDLEIEGLIKCIYQKKIYEKHTNGKNVEIS